MHRDDLEEILNIVDQLNPSNDTRLAAGMVTITCDNSSGIGSVIEMEVPVDINGLYGTFKKTIVDESNW
jgi:hypothetical protein